MKVLKIVGLLLVLAIAGVLALAAMKPNDFWVERSASIKAPADKIFPYLNSPKAAATWQPFLEPDPNAKVAYEGPENGVGAASTWDGNSEVGAGRIEITDSKPSSEVTLKLDFTRPMEGHNVVSYELEPEGDGTKMTWRMTGEQPFFGKLVSVFIDCDKMIGDQFEKGLAKLKAVAEKP